jgi:hypothetical protein
MKAEPDQSIHFDAEDEFLYQLRLFPGDNGWNEDEVFADSMDYQEFDDMGQDFLTRPFDDTYDDDAMKTNIYSISPEFNTILFVESSELKAKLRQQQHCIQEMMSVESYPDPYNPDVAKPVLDIFFPWIGKTVDQLPPEIREYHLYDRFREGFQDTDSFQSFKKTAKHFDKNIEVQPPDSYAFSADYIRFIFVLNYGFPTGDPKNRPMNLGVDKTFCNPSLHAIMYAWYSCCV